MSLENRVTGLSGRVLHSGELVNTARTTGLSLRVLRSTTEAELIFWLPLLDESAGDIFPLQFVEHDANLGFLDEGDLVYPIQLADNFNLAFLDETGDTYGLRFEVTADRFPETLPFEWNPFRPDIPIEIAADNPNVYEYLREQSELLRDQHNKTQAGDSSFPWQMLTTVGDRAVHTLGSLSRFQHEDYGILQGRYVRFSENWKVADNPFVGIDKSKAEWNVSNDESKTELFRPVGASGPYYLSPAGRYGWVLTEGRAPFPIKLISETQPAQFQSFTWDQVTGHGLVGPGPQVGIIVGSGPFIEQLQPDSTSYSPKRWTIPEGAWYAKVEGVTPEYIEATASLVNSALEARVETLEQASGQAGSYDAEIASLVSGLAATNQQLTIEVNARTIGDNALNNRVAQVESDILGLGTPISLTAIELRLDALEGDVAILQTDLATTTTGHHARLNALEGWRTTAQNQIDGLVVAVQGLSDPTFLNLVDTPDDYTGTGGRVVRVNTGATALEFHSLTAADVPFVPAAGIAATQVQAAIEEVVADVATSLALKANLSGATFTGDIIVPAEAYGVGWNGSNEAPTKNDVYDKIETLGGGGGGGSAWDFVPPLASSFSLATSGVTNLTLTDDTSAGLLIDTGVVASEGRVAYRTLTTKTLAWDMVAKIRMLIPNPNYTEAGIIAWDSISNKNYRLRLDNTSAGVLVCRFSTLTAFTATDATFTIPGPMKVEWFRITFDGTNLKFFISPEGKQWLELFSVSYLTFLGVQANRVGLYNTYSRTSGFKSILSCPYFSLTGAGV